MAHLMWYINQVYDLREKPVYVYIEAYIGAKSPHTKTFFSISNTETLFD